MPSRKRPAKRKKPDNMPNLPGRSSALSPEQLRMAKSMGLLYRDVGLIRSLSIRAARARKGLNKKAILNK